MKRLTLDEIAKLAGVSRATVSRVVNNYPHIKPEVRERVQAIISQTGFQPNLIARSLASDKSGIVGLVIPTSTSMVFSDPYFPTLIQGITRAINNAGLTLTFFLFHSKEEQQRTIRSILNTRLLDGVIITADRAESSFVPQFILHDLPIVLVGRPESNDRISYVDSDNSGGAYVATEHLITLGRRRIATVASRMNTAGDDRLAGYLKALSAYGMEADPRRIVYADFSMQSGYEGAKVLLEQRPDAIFAGSDTMALGVMRAIREAGLRVPDDIAVVGFDDLPPALQAEPPLTTVRQPVEELGSMAVELLIKVMASNGSLPTQVVVPTQLIIRASCGAVQTGEYTGEMGKRDLTNQARSH